MSFAHETFEAFKAIGLDHELFAEEAIKPDPFMWRLEHWASDFVFKQHHFPGDDYDYAWALQPVFRLKEKAGKKAGKKEFRRSPIKTFVLAINSRTGAIQIFTSEITARRFQELKSAKNVREIVRDPSRWNYIVSGNLNALSHGVSFTLTQAAEKLTHRLLSGSQHIRLSDHHGYAQRVHDLTATELKDWLHGKMNEVASGYMAMIDGQAMDFALAYGRKNKYYGPATSVHIFNHIVAASPGIAREFRRGALLVLKPIEYLFDADPTFWADIDTGKPIYEALGKKLVIRPATAKHLVRNSEHLKSTFNEQQVSAYAPFLDAVDVSAWPQSSGEARYFKLMADYSIAYGNAFSRDSKQVIRDLAKGLDRSKSDCWKALFHQRLSRQQAFLEGQRELNRGYYRNGSSTITDDVLIQQFQQELRGINDMHADIRRRVIIPLLMIEFERQGFDVLKLTSIEGLAAEMGQKFWSGSPPNEQVSASSYWHSTRVNFQQRFESVAFTTTDACWRTLIGKPYMEIKVGGKKAVFVPLASDFALKEEGSAMGHCVGGYAIKCLRNGYHIFSIRDEDNNRASTFTCRDAPPVDGRPQVAFVENAAQRNSPPPSWARDAAIEFMRRVNDGELKVDWAAIHESKADFLTREVDMTIGYNFREEEQRTRIYSIYSPLVPRKITGEARDNPDALAQHLGIETAVSKYIKEAGNRLADLGIRVKETEAVRPPDAAIHPDQPAQGIHNG